MQRDTNRFHMLFKKYRLKAEFSTLSALGGALARFYENKPEGQAFYDNLKKNIVGEKELFSDYWTKRWEK